MLGGLTPAEFMTGLFAIMLINLILSGDNAVVIALASRNLPPDQRKKAIFFGSAAAIVLRVILTIVAVVLLAIPFLRAIGGLLLIYIGIKLLTDEEGDDDLEGSSNLMTAIKTIVIADLIMSLDNVLAVAAVSKGSYLLLIIGLALSIPIIIVGSQLLVWVMNKFPPLVYIGAGLIAYTAGEMINGDGKIAPLIYNYAGHEEELAEVMGFESVEELLAHGIPNSILNIPANLELILPILIVVIVCGVGWRIRSKRAAAEG